MTNKEVLELIEKYFTNEDLGYEDFDVTKAYEGKNSDPETWLHKFYLNKKESYDKLFELGITESNIVDSGGGMDQGSDIYRVYHLPQINMLFEIDGWYQSHYGSEWNNSPYLVEPKTIEKVIYVKAN